MNVKHGFSTLNRLLGKKNKNGNQLSKSTTNLSLSVPSNGGGGGGGGVGGGNGMNSSGNPQTTASTTALDKTSSSHLEQNKIPPLPVAPSNTPFEQTFRITVLLPHNQLYVARLGAKTKLEKLLELVCENKQLDPEKYEFRHPIDTSQVFSCELTIGAVGLTEIRLCHKSETYDNFNADEIIKLRHTTGRDSLSSSEFSSRNSKHTLKTASPYSSTNSLNSIDSAGMSTNYRGLIAVSSISPNSTAQSLSNSSTPTIESNQNHNQIQQPRPVVKTQHSNSIVSGGHPPVAPARKKRVAPRPPSQNSIPERDGVSKGISVPAPNGKLPQQDQLARKDFHVSSPNLTNNSDMTIIHQVEFHKINGPVDCNGNTDTSYNKNDSTNHNNNNILTNNNNGYTTNRNQVPEDVPKPKQRPASMHILGHEMNILRDSRYASSNSINDHHDSNDQTIFSKVPEPVPRKRVIAAKKRAPAPPPRGLQPPVATPRMSPAKHLQNQEPTPPAVRKTEDEGTHKTMDSRQSPDNFIHNNKTDYDDEKVAKESPYEEIDVVKRKKQEIVAQKINSSPTRHESESDHYEKIIYSEIGDGRDGQKEKETFEDEKEEKSTNHIYAVPQKLKQQAVQEAVKPAVESSSDDDDNIKVYNLKLGKTIVKPLNQEETKLSVKKEEVTDVPAWTVPIPAPPNFADTENERTDMSPAAESTRVVDEVMTELDQIISKEDTDKDSKHSSGNFVNSDIEDGYRGNKDGDKFSRQVLLQNLENDARNSEDSEFRSLQQPFSLESVDSNRSDSDFKSPQQMHSLESAESGKSDLISELNNVLNGNRGIESIIKKVQEEDEKIESVEPAQQLDNFKIQSYTNVASKSPSPPLEEKKVHEKRSQPPQVPEKPKEKEANSDEEKFVKKPPKTAKRSSITLSNSISSQLFRNGHNIQRSDSFHSTRYSSELECSSIDDFSQRSTSYISLNGPQKSESKSDLSQNYRQKSSSELSIGESPSLQSLIVMKSILNSRKNSLNNSDIMKNGEKESSTNGHIEDFQSSIESSTTSSPSINGKHISKHDSNSDSSKENSPKNKIISQNNNVNSSKSSDSKIKDNDKSLSTNNSSSDKSSAKDKEPVKTESEKKWKYQGPPSINLSTWNERPKVQVAIKNDSDYKLGVGMANANSGNNVVVLSQGYRNSMTIDHSPRNSLTSTRNDFPNLFAKHQQNANATAHDAENRQPDQHTQTVPFVKSAEYKKSISVIENDRESQFPKSLSAGNTMTLGRIPKINRTNHSVPTIKKTDSVDLVDGVYSNNVEKFHLNGNKDKDVRNPPTAGGYWKSTTTLNQHNGIHRTGVERSNSTIIKTNSSMLLSEKSKESTVPPFSQVTLRRTGLKEKILAANESDNVNSIPVVRHSTPLQLQQQEQNCAKLEVKLLRTTSSAATAPTVTKSSVAKETPTPAPPPPPVIRAVVTKRNSANGIGPGLTSLPGGHGPSSAILGVGIDPRDQLLNAIRGFNRNSLKHN